jgi:phage terminase large subunit-like protein
LDTNQKRELLKKLKEREKIEADRNIDRFIPSPVQKAFLLSRAKTRIVEGANRSGKTEVCAVDTIIQNTGRIPDIIKDSYPKEYIRAGRYWISSRSFGASRDVAKPKVERYLPKLLVDRFNKADYIYYLKDGSQIGFKSMDAGMIAYSGDSRLQVWMDEEHSKDVFKEAYMRTIDCSGRIVMSFTPVDGLTWAYNDLYKKAKYRYFTRNKHGIKEETGKIHTAEEIELLKDRELHVRENTDNTADPNIEVFQMTMYDNKYIPSVQVQNAERECADDMALYQARILGIFAKITGNCVYPTELIIEGKAKCPMFFERGDIEDRKFIQINCF